MPLHLTLGDFLLIGLVCFLAVILTGVVVGAARR